MIGKKCIIDYYLWKEWRSMEEELVNGQKRPINCFYSLYNWETLLKQTWFPCHHFFTAHLTLYLAGHGQIMSCQIYPYKRPFIPKSTFFLHVKKNICIKMTLFNISTIILLHASMFPLCESHFNGCWDVYLNHVMMGP